MSSSSRSALLTKTHKVLKKHYTPVQPPVDRPLLEHLLYACCLEDSKYEAADEAFAKLQQLYFDWNEVRVTTVAELSEVLAHLADPQAAAQRLRRALQSVFETHYSFDVDFLKKENLGKASKKLEQYDGVTPFAVAYITQAGLGGHAIPVSRGALEALVVLGIASSAEADKKHVPGLERAIPKPKGIEFASLLHQLGVDYLQAPFSTRLRTALVEVEPAVKDRLPKRGKKEPAEPAAGGGEPAERPPARKKKAAPKAGSKPQASKPQPPAKKTAAVRKSSKSPAKRLVKKKPR